MASFQIVWTTATESCSGFPVKPWTGSNMSRTQLSGFLPTANPGSTLPPFSIPHLLQTPPPTPTNPSNPWPPQYLSDLLHGPTLSRSLRSSDSGPLSIPRTCRRTFGDRAFSVAAPTIWNSLPSKIYNAPTLDSFKSALKTYVFTQAFGPKLTC